MKKVRLITLTTPESVQVDDRNLKNVHASLLTIQSIE